MTLQDFVDYYTKGGEADVTFTNVYINQCMALMHAYVYEVLEITDKLVLAQPSAYEVYSNFNNEPGRQYFERIANEPTNFPMPGDIVVFNQKVGPDGHVAVCVSADVNAITSFDANWNDGTVGAKPHIVKHSFTNSVGEPIVEGWLRPIVNMIPPSINQVQEQLKNELYALDTCQTQLKTATVLNKTQQDQIALLQTDMKALQLKYDTEHTENTKLLAEVAAFTDNRLNYAQAADLSNTQASQLADNIHNIAGHTGVTTTGLDDNQITNQINAQFSEQMKTINDQKKLIADLQKQTVQNVVNQGLNALPPQTRKNILNIISSPVRKFLGLFVAQN